MEIFYYHLTKEISKNEKIAIITDCLDCEKNSNIMLIHVSSRLFILRRFGFAKMSLFITSIIQIFRYRREIDVIHLTTASNGGFYGSFFPIINKTLGIPYVVSFHGGGLHRWSKFSFFPKLFKSADRSIAVSSVIKETLEFRTGRKFDLILPLVPFVQSNKTRQKLRDELNLDDSSKIVLMVGSIKPIKGSRFIVESFMELGKEFLNTHKLILLLAGDGIDRTTIEKLTIELGFSDFIKFTGNIANEKVHELFFLSDIYIIASEFEGTSKSMLEAMYNRLPILASDVKGINNIIKDENNGLLFQYNNKAVFIRNLTRLVEDSILASRIACAAKETYDKNYSFVNTVDSYRSILNEVLTKKSESSLI